MTFIKVDTGLMQALINNLNDRAEAVEDERSSIYITSMNIPMGLSHRWRRTTTWPVTP